MNSGCFLCARLTEATRAAEKRAEVEAARAKEIEKVLDRTGAKSRRYGQELRAAAHAAMAALYVPPLLVVPYVYRPRAPAAPRDRFALLELE